MSNKKIALVLKGYPRLSETFIAQEILELERAGFDISIISLRHPTDKKSHPIHSEISADRHYLPEYLHVEPIRVLKALASTVGTRGFWKLLPGFCKDLARDLTVNRVRRFGQALVMAREYAPDHDHFYVHFLHTPCSVARYAAVMTGKSFSISAHAKDIWTSPDWEIQEKIADADWLVTCTKGAAEHLSDLAPNDRVRLVYHGLDLTRFPVFDRPDETRDGANEKEPVRLVTVGRAVAKKGIDSLLEALASLPPDLHWRWTHIGGGPLKPNLEEQAQSLGIQESCDFKGSLPQSEVLETYRASDLFILPSRIDETGDRDGLPNVIVEAQSQKLPVISTTISGIPELIDDGINGILLEPDDVNALTDAVHSLCTNPTRRQKMGEAGEAKVRSEFSHTQTIGVIVDLLNESLEGK